MGRNLGAPSISNASRTILASKLACQIFWTAVEYQSMSGVYIPGRLPMHAAAFHTEPVLLVRSDLHTGD